MRTLSSGGPVSCTETIRPVLAIEFSAGRGSSRDATSDLTATASKALVAVMPEPAICLDGRCIKGAGRCEAVSSHGMLHLHGPELLCADPLTTW